MPNALVFDTLAYAKKLKAAGFTDLQAEVQTEALVEIVEGRLATRQNLKETETALRRDMKEMEQRLTIRLGGLIATAIIIVAAMVKLL